MSQDEKNKGEPPADDQAHDAENGQAAITGSATPPADRSPKKKPNRLGTFFLVLILILIVFSSGGYAAYYYLSQQFLDREASFSADIQRLSTELEGLKQADSLLIEQLIESQADIQTALTAAVSDTESQMVALAERLSASESAGPADWTLAEVEYLLRIANQRLMTNRDSDTAVSMLLAADEILRELAYPELAVVRRQLSADITALQVASKVDVEGVYFAIEALASEVGKLSSFAPEYIESAGFVAEEGASGFERMWRSVANVLSKFVRIESNVGAPEYLVTNDEKALRHLSIQLQMRQAQLALLAGEQQVYSSALVQASAALIDYYGENEPVVHISERLIEFSNRGVEMDSMNINGSIRILSNVVDQLAQLEKPGEVPE